MPDPGSWWQLFSAALGGGLTVKALEIGYAEYSRRTSAADEASRFVDTHLEPLLKSADELVGKMRSLAESDFKPIVGMIPDETSLENPDFAGLVFLFGRFWGHVEIIRHEGMSITMSESERGSQLKNFLDCLESRRVRIIDRITQRAIGETFMQGAEIVSFLTFVDRFENHPELRRWMMPLVTFLSRMEHTTERQQLLQYVAVLHALIDTLDPDHHVTRERPSTAGKLTKRSWRDLNYRVFGVYLKFVKDRAKYIGPPKAVRKEGGNAKGL